jgi:hypothetical protein
MGCANRLRADVRAGTERFFSARVEPGRRQRAEYALAMRDQLGLKLQAGKAKAEFLVIDHVEKAHDGLSDCTSCLSRDPRECPTFGGRSIPLRGSASSRIL